MAWRLCGRGGNDRLGKAGGRLEAHPQTGAAVGLVIKRNTAAKAAALLEWEKQPANRTFLDEAFRVMHTFKGNAGFMGLAPLEEVGHELESVLEALRQGRTAQTAECSLLLKTVDSLREGVEKLASGEKEYLPAKGALIKMLQGLQGKEAAETSGEGSVKAESKPVLAAAEGPKNGGEHPTSSQLMHT